MIIRVNPNDGSAPKGNPFPNDNLTSRYWAYGIRNSFGLAIDPITHNLWATENGPSQYDGINIVSPVSIVDGRLLWDRYGVKASLKPT